MQTIIHSEPKQIEFFQSIRIFLRTAWAVLRRPRIFFADYFSANGTSQQLPTISAYLGVALGLHALILPLHHLLLRMGGFPEEILAIANWDRQQMVALWEQIAGQPVILFNLMELTGIAFFDSPVEDAARMALYWVFAGLFALLSGGRLPRHKMVGYFAYAFGASLLVETVGMLIGDLILVVLAGSGSFMDNYFYSSLVDSVAILPRILYMFVIPALIFPAILPNVTRRLVIRTTILFLVVWGGGGMILYQLLLSMGIVVMLPGL